MNESRITQSSRRPRLQSTDWLVCLIVAAVMFAAITFGVIPSFAGSHRLRTDHRALITEFNGEFGLLDEGQAPSEVDYIGLVQTGHIRAHFGLLSLGVADRLHVVVMLLDENRTLSSSEIEEVFDQTRKNWGVEYGEQMSGSIVPGSAWYSFVDPTRPASFEWGVAITLLLWIMSIASIPICLCRWGFAARRELNVKRKSRAVAAGLCPECRYDMRGTTMSRCPECGAIWGSEVAEALEPR